MMSCSGFFKCKIWWVGFHCRKTAGVICYHLRGGGNVYIFLSLFGGGEGGGGGELSFVLLLISLVGLCSLLDKESTDGK